MMPSKSSKERARGESSVVRGSSPPSETPLWLRSSGEPSMPSTPAIESVPGQASVTSGKESLSLSGSGQPSESLKASMSSATLRQSVVGQESVPAGSKQGLPLSEPAQETEVMPTSQTPSESLSGSGQPSVSWKSS